jgi:hypothetical protein
MPPRLLLFLHFLLESILVIGFVIPVCVILGLVLVLKGLGVLFGLWRRGGRLRRLGLRLLPDGELDRPRRRCGSLCGRLLPVKLGQDIVQIEIVFVHSKSFSRKKK